MKQIFLLIFNFRTNKKTDTSPFNTRPAARLGNHRQVLPPVDDHDKLVPLSCHRNSSSNYNNVYQSWRILFFVLLQLIIGRRRRAAC